MTKLERVIRQVSDLRDFCEQIKKARGKSERKVSLAKLRRRPVKSTTKRRGK